MIEEWKVIESYSDYQISNLGRVKSLKTGKERILKGGKTISGYSFISLSNKIKVNNKLISRLVLLHFKPISNPELFQCNHINGIKKDNKLENLEWCTASENMKHAYRIGLAKGYNRKGENHPIYGKHRSVKTKRKISEKNAGEKCDRHKLTKEQVIEIRKLINEGKLTQTAIAKMYGVCIDTISKIKLGRNWKNII